MDLQLFSLYHTNKPGPCKIIYFLSLKSHQPESQHSSLNKVLFSIGYDFFQVDPATDLLSVRRVSDGRLLLQMTELNFTKATVKVILTFLFPIYWWGISISTSGYQKECFCLESGVRRERHRWENLWAWRAQDGKGECFPFHTSFVQQYWNICLASFVMPGFEC